MKRIVDNGLLAERGIFVHGCNAQGVMGSGVAKEVKDRYPSAFKAYRETYESQNKSLTVGTITYVEPRKDFLLVNAITQKFYGYDGKLYLSYEGLEQAFQQVATIAKERNLPILFPLIGCDRGGGDWTKVKQIIEKTCDGCELVLYTLDYRNLPSGPNVEPSSQITMPIAKTRPRFQ